MRSSINIIFCLILNLGLAGCAVYRYDVKYSYSNEIVQVKGLNIDAKLSPNGYSSSSIKGGKYETYFSAPELENYKEELLSLHTKLNHNHVSIEGIRYSSVIRFSSHQSIKSCRAKKISFKTDSDEEILYLNDVLLTGGIDGEKHPNSKKCYYYRKILLPTQNKSVSIDFEVEVDFLDGSLQTIQRNFILRQRKAIDKSNDLWEGIMGI